MQKNKKNSVYMVGAWLVLLGCASIGSAEASGCTLVHEVVYKSTDGSCNPTDGAAAEFVLQADGECHDIPTLTTGDNHYRLTVDGAFLAGASGCDKTCANCKGEYGAAHPITLPLAPEGAGATAPAASGSGCVNRKFHESDATVDVTFKVISGPVVHEVVYEQTGLCTPSTSDQNYFLNADGECHRLPMIEGSYATPFYKATVEGGLVVGRASCAAGCAEADCLVDLAASDTNTVDGSCLTRGYGAAGANVDLTMVMYAGASCAMTQAVSTEPDCTASMYATEAEAQACDPSGNGAAHAMGNKFMPGAAHADPASPEAASYSLKIYLMSGTSSGPHPCQQDGSDEGAASSRSCCSDNVASLTIDVAEGPGCAPIAPQLTSSYFSYDGARLGTEHKSATCDDAAGASGAVAADGECVALPGDTRFYKLTKLEAATPPHGHPGHNHDTDHGQLDDGDLDGDLLKAAVDRLETDVETACADADSDACTAAKTNLAAAQNALDKLDSASGVTASLVAVTVAVAVAAALF